MSQMIHSKTSPSPVTRGNIHFNLVKVKETSTNTLTLVNRVENYYLQSSVQNNRDRDNSSRESWNNDSEFTSAVEKVRI